MKTLFLAVAACLALGSVAIAASPVTINNAANTDSAAVTNHALSVTLAGGTAAIGNVGGFDSGPVQATATPANSSHAAGTSVGGLFTLTMARTNGGSGQVTQVRFKSSGGSTGAYVVRIWDKNPSNSTCTDNSAFSGSATDDANLITPPFTMTPTAPANTTGDANTYAALLSTNFGFLNADTSPGKNLYACVVTVATDTADQNKAVYVTMDALQN